MLTLLGRPLKLALVSASALPAPRAMDRMKSKSGTRTPMLSRPGLSDLSNILFSPRFRTTVTGPGSKLSSKSCGK
uniref:Secreted protein n=1 Tax=Arundo donax TaxID=35708 RepID=A0A0A9D3T2_ARUDO